MKTKAVYVVVSSDGDIYFEQAWLSAWSLKYYNPEMEVIFVIDQNTYSSVHQGYRKHALEVISHIERVDVPSEFSLMQRSRWLKTNLREHVVGDFLFIDTDTIICGDLSELDHLPSDVMMVLNKHCLLSQSIEEDRTQSICEKIYGKKLHSDEYFNSGVIYCKDTPVSHQFYHDWHQMWLTAMSKGSNKDQPPLALVLEETPVVKELDGIYNCQVRHSIKYLAKGKIMHFFNAPYYPCYANPFFGDEVYIAVKKQQGISPDIQQMALDCKSLFVSPSLLIARDELIIRNSVSFKFLKQMRQSFPCYYHCIEFVSKVHLLLFRATAKMLKYFRKKAYNMTE